LHAAALKESAKQASCKEEIKTNHKQYHDIRRELIDIDESFKSAIPAIMSKAEEAYLLRQVLVGLDQAITVVGILIIPKISRIRLAPQLYSCQELRRPLLKSIDETEQK
jgi:hypothetical protein